MRINYLKTMFGIVSLAFLLIYCKKSSDSKAETYTTERQWIHENGGIYKNETLMMKSIDGSSKTASLNWSAVRIFKIGETNYTEIPFSFPGGRSSTQLSGISDNDVSFSLMIRTFRGKTEAAIKFSQRNVKIINANAEKSGIIEGYSTLEGAQLNMWFTDDAGKLMTMRKQSSTVVKTNDTKTKVIDYIGGDCTSISVPTYEFQCWITGGAYNDTACGWIMVGSAQFLICTIDGGGGGDWPPSIGGGTPPSTPPPATPCGGDALVNPTVALSSKNNKNGGRFGPTRTNPDGSPKMHKGIDLSAVPNTPVYAAFGGEVVRYVSSYPPTYFASGSFGNLVEIRTTLSDGSTYTTLYGHLNSTSVSVGSTVSAGDQIGVSGRTGNAQKVPFPHVHVQIRQNGVLVNPEPFLATKFDSQGNSTGRPCN